MIARELNRIPFLGLVLVIIFLAHKEFGLKMAWEWEMAIADMVH